VELESMLQSVFSLPLFFTWHFEKLAAWPTREPHSCCVVQKNQLSGGHGGGGRTYRERLTRRLLVEHVQKRELLHMLYIPLKEGAPPTAASAPFMWHNTPKGANYSRD
jgi:hypothetical protein